MVFSLSPAMRRYLEQVASVEGKKFACLVTQAFPFAWLGGNRAVGQMREALQAKGAAFCEAGIVNWNRSGRERQIAEVVDRISGAL